MSEVVSFHKLSVDDAPKIAAAISQLVKIGFKPLFPEREFPELARRKTEELEGIGIEDPPLPQTWVALALAGSEQAFANAIHYQDHCFDGAGEEAYAEVVASIIALAGEEWPGAGATVAAKSVVRQGRYGPSPRMEITIHQQEGCAPFDLIAAKDFDWSVATRLNERLPAGATGRFAAFFDGNATIVYLGPDQLWELGKLSGCNFVSEIEQLSEESLSPGHVEATGSEPVDFVAQVGCLLMGVFAASKLIAMTLRGAPYTISAGVNTVSLANTPIAFAVWVAIWIAAAGLLLWIPIHVFVRRWRALRRERRESP